MPRRRLHPLLLAGALLPGASVAAASAAAPSAADTDDALGVRSPALRSAAGLLLLSSRCG
jgi:hypothetical protein